MVGDSLQGSTERFDVIVVASGAAGARSISVQQSMDPFGHAIHECGVASMDNNLKRAVLNRYRQSHDIKNLFVMDGSAFVAVGNLNPTLTRTARVCHACDDLAKQAGKGELS